MFWLFKVKSTFWFWEVIHPLLNIKRFELCYNFVLLLRFEPSINFKLNIGWKIQIWKLTIFLNYHGIRVFKMRCTCLIIKARRFSSCNQSMLCSQRCSPAIISPIILGLCTGLVILCRNVRMMMPVSSSWRACCSKWPVPSSCMISNSYNSWGRRWIYRGLGVRGANFIVIYSLFHVEIVLIGLKHWFTLNKCFIYFQIIKF